MATIKFSKVASLPGTPVANTMYLVKNGSSVKIYVTDSAGAVMPVIGNTPEIEPFLLLGVNCGS